MGTEVCSDNWGRPASPRISFSHDLSQSDLSSPTTDARRSDGSLPLDVSALEFDFSVSIEISAQDPSPADDIFFGGKILPLPIKSSGGSPSAPPPPPTKPSPPIPIAPILDRKGSLREVIAATDDDNGDNNKGADGRRRSFWRFGRSISVGGSRKAGLICPCPIALARSNSTGSYLNPNPNPNPIQKPPSNQNSSSRINNIIKKNSSLSFRKTSSESDGRNSYYYSQSNNGSCRNGLRISPVLNVPAPLIPRGGGGSSRSNSSRSSSGGVNTSVLAYLLCNCNDKNMKRSAVCCSP